MANGGENRRRESLSGVIRPMKYILSYRSVISGLPVTGGTLKLLGAQLPLLPVHFSGARRLFCGVALRRRRLGGASMSYGISFAITSHEIWRNGGWRRQRNAASYMQLKRRKRKRLGGGGGVGGGKGERRKRGGEAYLAAKSRHASAQPMCESV